MSQSIFAPAEGFPWPDASKLYRSRLLFASQNAAIFMPWIMALRAGLHCA